MGKEERGSVRVPAPRLPPMNEMMTSALFSVGIRKPTRGHQPTATGQIRSVWSRCPAYLQSSTL
jgi:hypothetical protein